MDKNYIHIYYGYGKGKTTAAVGLAYRCANRGKNVLFTAFLKNKDSGEFLGNPPFEIDNFASCDKFWEAFSPEEIEIKKSEAKSRLQRICNDAEKYDLIVLDELLDAVRSGCLECRFVIDLVSEMRAKSEIVITGHDKISELFDLADYITEFKNERHPYDKGVVAREGIEY